MEPNELTFSCLCKVLEILHTYIGEILEPGSGDMDLCQEALPTCIEYCIELEVT
jgi:hypothetical protein